MIKFSDTTQFDLRNALILARAAELAYQSETRIQKTVLEEWKFQDCRFISRRDTQLFLARQEGHVVLAFRGTAEIKDWLTDADTRLRKISLGRVHSGFCSALLDVWEDLDRALREWRVPSDSLWITGHSLGGALAGLAAMKLTEEGEEISGLYTFGQPRFGDAQVKRFWENKVNARYFRFTNNNDIVPRVPTRAHGYRDIGRSCYFNVAGDLFTDIQTWRMFLDALAGMADRALDRFRELKHDVLINLGSDWVLDHAMKNYVALVEKAAWKEKK